MKIDASGNIVDTHEYILDSISAWMQIDRNDIYGYTFRDFYIDYSRTSSIKTAIEEIIEKLSLGCIVKSVTQNLSRTIVNLEYNGESLSLEI